jgi:hypothetical protein
MYSKSTNYTHTSICPVGLQTRHTDILTYIYKEYYSSVVCKTAVVGAVGADGTPGSPFVTALFSIVVVVAPFLMRGHHSRRLLLPLFRIFVAS